MHSSSSEVIALTIIISTILILFFGSALVYYIFLIQKRRFRHQKEVLELKEAFNQTLLQSKIEIQEQTLDHISKELHANFSHLVSLININLQELLPQSSSDVRENILETKSLAKQLLSELKALSASLNTDHIMHIGFVKAFELELSRVSKVKKYDISITKTGEEYRLKAEYEIILFRLCQEILNNIVKYSKAKKVTTIIHFLPQSFELEIFDDGIGFNVDVALTQSAEKGSTGLTNMKKRAKLLNGDIQVLTKEREGTKIIIRIPI